MVVATGWWNNMRSLRWRLAWTFTLLSTFAVLVQAVALFVTTEEREEDLIDEIVNTSLDNMVRDGKGARVAGEHSLSPRIEFYRMPQGQHPATIPPKFATTKAGNYEWFVGDTEFHIGIRDDNGDRLYLLYDATAHETRLDQMFWSLAFGLVVLSLISLWLGYWLAGRMLFQLEKITQRLHDDDSAILNEPDFDREVSLLAMALDKYRQRNRELLAREREFTANVSHELRTPLTRIRTSAELFTEDAALSERGRSRADRIINAVDDMESRLSGLLFLARELTPAERAAVNLAQAVESCLAHFRKACATAGIQLESRIAPDATVQADPALLHLLLENLVGNAVRYTERGTISVDFQEGTLTVADTGTGIPAEHLQHVFERYYRASDRPGGLGLGLSIVRRVCEVHGWRYAIESVADAGNPKRGTQVLIHMRT